MSVRNMTFDDLEPGMRVYHPEQEAFGQITQKVTDDPDWLMIEVKWDNDDESVDDRSFVLAGTQIAAIVPADSELMTELLAHMGDDIEKVRKQHGANVPILNMVELW